MSSLGGGEGEVCLIFWNSSVMTKANCEDLYVSNYNRNEPIYFIFHFGLNESQAL